MHRPLCFVDSTYYSSDLFPEIANALSGYPTICQVGASEFQFKVVGIVCASGRPVVVFPKNYSAFIEGDEYTAEAKTLARVLIRYRNEPLHDDLELPLLHGDNEMSSSRITAAMFLLDDYCQNGFIRRQNEVSTTMKSGRTDWASTINKTTPLFSNLRPLYPNPIVRKNTADEENLIRIIHKVVVNECFREWGWFFGYDDYVDTGISLPVHPVEAMRKLSAELRKTFVARDIQVIRKLIEYLAGRYGNENEQKIDVLATPYFSFVWESVCGFLLSNQYNRLKSLLPQPVWESHLVDGRISQRPDIFHVNGTGLYIFDAKYYDYTRNIPGWHDAVKQFFYRHTLNSVLPRREFGRLLPDANAIYNAFVFPGHNSDFEYVGRIHVPRTEDLGEIKAFSINQKKALSSYAYRDDSHFSDIIREKVAESFA